MLQRVLERTEREYIAPGGAGLPCPRRHVARGESNLEDHEKTTEKYTTRDTNDRLVHSNALESEKWYQVMTHEHSLLFVEATFVFCN